MLAICISGCTNRSLAGRYVGKRQMTGPEHIVGTASKVELTLKSDGKFLLLNLSVPFEGKWEPADANVKLIVDTAAGMRQPKPVEIMVVKVAGGLELRDDKGMDPTPVLLIKQ